MTNRLVLGAYIGTTMRKPGPFNLSDGQMRTAETIHNGRWYNSRGERLGEGSLSPADIRSIEEGLEEREIFIILGEYTRDYGPLDDSPAPGIAYVIRNCYAVITRAKAYWVDHSKRPAQSFDHRGVTFETIGPQRFEELIAQANA